MFTQTNSVQDILMLIKEKGVKFVDLRFTDTLGKEQHMTVSTNVVDKNFFQEGKMFDGSSIAGWKSIESSDMALRPDPTTAVFDPFYEKPTLHLRCDVTEPNETEGYERDPRTVARKAEAYLKSTGIGDVCNIGPEPEFFIFDNVRWQVAVDHIFFRVDSEEAHWNSAVEIEGGNLGHRPTFKGGYVPVPPVDSSQNIRSAISLFLEEMGMKVEGHHHEVATGNQNEISVRYDSLLKKADQLQQFKYVVHNVAHMYGKSATFMPKPLVNDNGSGMHCHLSLFKEGSNVFSGDKYAGLSDEALFFIAGVLRHARALNAFTNATTNSYKRLVPGFEAPVMLAYSERNRSAAIRIPHSDPKGKRIEIRFPDPCCNPYLAFSALLMAGLDGIKNEWHPGEAVDKDLYTLSCEEARVIPTVCGTLQEAIEHLKKDQAFLLEGGVFTEDVIDSYIELKRAEIRRLRMTTHPVEFDLYYSS